MKYTKNLIGVSSILVGTFLIIEHILHFGEFSFFDFIGHEWLGMLLIFIGCIININWSKSEYSHELKKYFDLQH